MDRGTWHAIVHRVTKRQTPPSMRAHPAHSLAHSRSSLNELPTHCGHSATSSRIAEWSSLNPSVTELMHIWLGIKQLCFRFFFLFAPLILQWHFDLNLLVSLPILFSVFSHSHQTSLRALFLFLLTCWVINSVSSADTCLCQVMKIFSDRQYQPHPSFRRTPSASSVTGIQWEQVLRKGATDSTKFRVSPHWVWTISDRSLLEWCSRNKPEAGTGHFLPFISLERKAPFLPSSFHLPCIQRKHACAC